jgi:Tfp pilus assembly protein PilV
VWTSNLQEDFGKTSAAVTNVLGFMGLGSKKNRVEQEVEQQQQQQQQQQQEATGTRGMQMPLSRRCW